MADLTVVSVDGLDDWSGQSRSNEIVQAATAILDNLQPGEGLFRSEIVRTIHESTSYEKNAISSQVGSMLGRKWFKAKFGVYNKDGKQVLARRTEGEAATAAAEG